MTPNLKRFSRLSEGATSHDGTSVKLRIEAEGAEPLDVAMTADSLGDSIQYLTYLLADAESKRTDPEEYPKQDVNIPPIPAKRLALMLGHPGKAILLVRLGHFDLGFELSLAALQDAQSSFARTINTLAKEPTGRQ
jgi:hypothetical protein